MLGRRGLSTIGALAAVGGSGLALLACTGARTATPVPAAAARPREVQRFGLVKPCPRAREVLFAQARRWRPAGPETLRPVHVRRYRAARLAPGADIHVTAPIYQGDLTDWLRGARVSPERFAASYRAEVATYGPPSPRGHMFDVWFDERGRITRMHQIFSP